MKSTNCLVHGMVVLGGLLLGLALREGLKPEKQQIATVDTKLEMRSRVGRKRIGESQLHQVERILAEGPGVRMTPEDEALLQHSLFQLKRSDYPVALEALLAKDFEAHRFMNFAKALFSEWGKKDPLQALEALNGVPFETQAYLGTVVYLGWSLTDPDAAFEHAEQNSARIQGEFMEGLMTLWSDFAEERPEQALARLAKLKKGDMNRMGLQDDVIRRIGCNRPDLALDWVMNHREGKELKSSLSSLIESWGKIDFEQAFGYVKDLPEELQDTRIFKGLGSSFSGNLEESLAMGDALPQDYQDDFLGGVIESLAHSKLQHAAEVGKVLVEGKAKEGAYYNLATHWALSDPVATGEWLLTLPRSPSRDSAIRGFVQRIDDQSPEAAMEWLLDVDDSAARKTGLWALAEDWLKSDEITAKEWISQQSLENFPEKVKMRLFDEE